ncbi:unnamed protein product [Fraxinus pennsylvanica]|uniref:Retrotransposon Copia-like N-terminal domain-containing protein n=1 Tax=Fraxinus pennsylvanica TaxID=56036 RepID=A0AAD2E401_9LAMI|nr:unnamed protein product [Fraxinus pennsylvanica]
MANTGSNDNAQSATSTLMPSTLGRNQMQSFGINLTQVPPIKLDMNNFLLWKNMVISIIKGHNLEGFITEMRTCPAEFLAIQTTGSAGVTFEMTPNVEYGKWMSTDQLLMG